jgi:hypothetical protein
MGKYGKHNFVPINLQGSDGLNTLLMIISNELAEANRLKRLELKILPHLRLEDEHWESDDGHVGGILEQNVKPQDLEDQA